MGLPVSVMMSAVLRLVREAAAGGKGEGRWE